MNSTVDLVLDMINALDAASPRGVSAIRLHPADLEDLKLEVQRYLNDDTLVFSLTRIAGVDIIVDESATRLPRKPDAPEAP